MLNAYTFHKNFSKVYSSVVEQAAHNGLVIGSIPIKLIFAKMKLDNKNNKSKKINNYIKKTNIFFIFLLN